MSKQPDTLELALRRFRRRSSTPEPPRARPYGYCAYCGTPCLNGVCRGHRDLPALDPRSPHYQEDT